MAKGRKPRVSRSPEVEREVLARLAKGQTLSSVCKREGMPDKSAVIGWALDVDDKFSQQYARAREIGYHCMADEMVDILDDSTNDYMTKTDADGNEYQALNPENIQRSRLRFEGRKWIVSKALPKIYGDKLALTDAEGGSVVFQVVSGVPRGTDGT